MELYEMTCEYQEEPIGVDTERPVFGWKRRGGKAGASQRAYRIAVYHRDGRLVFDSGMVMSDAQTGVELDLSGRLQIFTRYEVRLQVWDAGEDLEAWYESYFVTGIFKAYQWKGEWFDKTWGPYGRVGFYRKEFFLKEKEVDYAYLFLGATGEKSHAATAWINGTRGGSLANFPGATEGFRAFYAGINIQNQLLPRRNTVGLNVLTKASCVIRIRYKDGEEQLEYSDGRTWKYILRGPYTELGYEYPMCRGKLERYDARNAVKGWNENGFDDSGWEFYRTNEPPITWAPLFIRCQYCTASVQKQMKPVRILRTEGGYFVDFGVNLSGFVSFRLKGTRGRTVRIRYAEKKTKDGMGAVFAEEYPGVCYYTFGSDGWETYIPQFMMVGFCCVEIDGYEGEADESCFTAHFIHSDLLNRSDFSCSDESLNRLHEVSRRSFLCNLVNIPTDCPERERRGWTADAYAVSEAECVNFNMVNFYYQWFESMRDCQRGNGWIPVELPLSTETCIDVNWPMACTFIAYEVYMQYGDKRFLRRFYDMMKRYSDLLLDLCDDTWQISDMFLSYKDWLAEEPASSGFIGMAYLYRNTWIMGKIAGILGRKEEERDYGERANEIRNALNLKYLHWDHGIIYYDNNSQSANAHALFFSICPENLKAQVTDSLVKNIREKNANTTGFMGTMCMLQALAQNGCVEEAFRLLKNKNPGGWLYLTEIKKVTTFPETYDGKWSQNHAFLGSAPGLFLYKYLGGISPVLPGYKKIRVQPYIPDGMNHAHTEIETIYGVVSVWWKRMDSAEEKNAVQGKEMEKKEDRGSILMKLEIPKGTTAELIWEGKTVLLEAGHHERRIRALPGI